jgi:predicted NBD/HSP70 family sugar kinase
LQSRQISHLHLYQVLHAMRLAGEPQSRAEVAELTRLSQPAVSSLTRRLLESGALMETGARPSLGGGRRERELALNPEHAWVVGVKVSLHQCTVSLADFAGGVRNTVNWPLDAPMTPAAFVKLMTRRIGAFIDEAGAHVRSRLAGVGVALPGFIDSIEGEVHWSAVLRGARGAATVPLAQALTDALGVPVLIENDANMLALAEQWFGQSAGLNNTAVVTLEHGLGLGLVLNGELYRGHAGLAAELAHIQIDAQGHPCRCGKRGCLETYVTHDAVVREARAAKVLPPARGEESFEAIVATYTGLVERARGGERAAIASFQRHGRLLGQWLGNVVNLLAPQLVMLDLGGVVAADLYEHDLRAAMDEAMVMPHRGRVALVVRHRGDEVWARGAASLVLQRLDESAEIVESVSRHGFDNEKQRRKAVRPSSPLRAGARPARPPQPL